MRHSRINILSPAVKAKLSNHSHDNIPIIVSFKKDKSTPSGKISLLSNKVNYELPIVNGYACEMSSTAIKELYSNSNIAYISYDEKVFAQIDIASKNISSDIPHNLGYTGKDITVAVIDTGVSLHNDLTQPNNRIVGFKDFINKKTESYDDNGHGTHVAGIIASNGYSSDGKYSGIAPDANILSIKVLDANGSGNTSDIISAVQWVIDTKDVYNTKILNFSFGTPTNYRERKDPLVKAANAAIDAGLIVIVAAGNSGPSKRTILSPANSRYVISVGAIDDNRTAETYDNFVANFSSRGPTLDGINKPDLSAPGVDIMSLSNTDLKGYLPLSGTSMATPVVSGAAALLLGAHPNYSHFEIKKILKRSCYKIGATSNSQGAGALDLSKIFKSKKR